MICKFWQVTKICFGPLGILIEQSGLKRESTNQEQLPHQIQIQIPLTKCYPFTDTPKKYINTCILISSSSTAFVIDFLYRLLSIMKTYKLLKYQDKGKGTMELKSEVPDFKKNKTHNTFTGQFTEEKKFN